MNGQNTKFFSSLRPTNDPDEIINYSAYKEAFDFCFAEKKSVSNVGVIGDYGTGKSTIINAYIENDLDKEEYEVINVSLLTLEKRCCQSIEILKNIIKQIVHNPKKTLTYNILKFQDTKVDFRKILPILGFVFAFLLVFFSNSNMFSKIPLLSSILQIGIPYEVFRISKYILLAAIVILFIGYIYPLILSGIRINKLKVSDAFETEMERATDAIVNEELDYIEYLVYLLKREKKDLVLIIEDIDRFENLRIFQQLREVNNLLNNMSNGERYIFIYAVSNALFSQESDSKSSDNLCSDNEVSILKSYKSTFKEDVAKFFDFIINVTPAMDHQNSYDFIKKKLPGLLGEQRIEDEDLYMLSQYIDSPRVLKDIVNDFHMAKQMRHENSDFRDVKLLYYCILKSKFFNFYQIIHDVFSDLETVVNHYSNYDDYIDIEKSREDSFYSLCAFYAFKKNHSSPAKTTLGTFWKSISNIANIAEALEKFSKTAVYQGSSYTGGTVNFSELAQFAKEQNKEYIFSSELYRQQIGIPLQNRTGFSEALCMYYSGENAVMSRLIKDVENERRGNPNKVSFSIREFLDIDFIKLGILENLLDVNDYNMYITVNYLELNDSYFIRKFNLADHENALFTLRLFDINAVLSKMKIEKMEDQNGLNVHIVVYIFANKLRSLKAYRLIKLSMSSADFLLELFSHVKEKDITQFDVTKYLLENAVDVRSTDAVRTVIKWFDSSIPDETARKSLTQFLDNLSTSFSFSITHSNFKNETYLCLLSCERVTKDESTFILILKRALNGCAELANPLFSTYAPLLEDDSIFTPDEWLGLLNSKIAFILPYLNDQSKEIVKSAYIRYRKIKIADLSTIKDKVFGETIYIEGLYEYTPENINYLRSAFANIALTDYEPYCDISYTEFEVMQSYIRNQEISKLGADAWDKHLIAKLLNDSTVDHFKELVQFFSTENPIMIEKLADVACFSMNTEKLEVFIEAVTLYVNSYDNLVFVFEAENAALPTTDNKRVTFLDSMLAAASYDHETLLIDNNRFSENADIEKAIFSNAFQSDYMPISTFTRYAAIYPKTLADATELSSQDKMRIMFHCGKLEINFANLEACDSESLIQVRNESDEAFTNALSTSSPEKVVMILKKIKDKKSEINCLEILIKKRITEISEMQDLCAQYLSSRNDSREILENDVITLLKLFHENPEISKMVELLERKTGQRTISNIVPDIVTLLEERRIIKQEVQKDNRVLVRYR